MSQAFQEDIVRKLESQLPAYPMEMAALIHASRIIGSDPRLVLHGGGNTSAKTRRINLLGEEEEVLYVKGSGIDMASIGPEGFVELRLTAVKRLRRFSSIPDEILETFITSQRLGSASPEPSVEALLHAFLSHRFVFHCHADAILILTHQKNPKPLLESVLGNRVAVLSYARSGLPLARAIVRSHEQRPEIDAAVVIHHGLFTFSNEARHACDRILSLVKKAESHIRKQTKRPRIAQTKQTYRSSRTLIEPARVSQVIRGISAQKSADGRTRRRLVVYRKDPELVRASLSLEARKICRTGVLTPDHAIRTLNRMVYLDAVPETDGDLKEALQKASAIFQKDYVRYLSAEKPSMDEPSLSQATPVLYLVAGLGLFAVGDTLQEAGIAADIGERTILAKAKALALGGFQPTPTGHVRDMELWPLQRRKLRKPSEGLLTGQVAVVTGAGGAIGYGIARRLLASGASVAVADIDASRLNQIAVLLSKEFGSGKTVSVDFDVTHLAAVEKGFAKIGAAFGGIDLVVPNAGIAHVATIERLDSKDLDRVVAVNLNGTLNTIKAAVPIFKRQGTGGNIVLISSKNVFDPGAAFSAYSASKAAAHQMAKIAALELAELGVRVNMINPDAVFGDENVGSGLWNLVGPDRMRSRGLNPEGLREYYRQRSLLKVDVLAEHVGNAVVFFASEQTPTTGASLPVDAGNPAAFPR